MKPTTAPDCRFERGRMALATTVLAALIASSAACVGGDGGAGRDASAPGPRPGILLILVDCLRADHMGAYGYPRDTSPHLDALAAEGIVFERTIAQANWTKPSIASLFTGTYVSQHGLTEGHIAGEQVEEAGALTGHVLSSDLETMAELLSANGYATAAFVNQGHLADYMGFAQGFDVYEDDLGDPEVEKRFGAWLPEVRSRPFFAYLHILDLHFPYRPPDHVDRFADSIEPRVVKKMMLDDPKQVVDAAENGNLTEENIRELRALYDGEILVVDDRVRRILKILRDHELYDDALIVVTSDHGEALLEHGQLQHGGMKLYEEVLRIPWIMRLPGGARAGTRVGGVVQLADILPTVLDYLELEAPGGIGGRSVLTRIKGLQTGPRTDVARESPVLAETSDLSGPRAYYEDGLKFIFHPDAEPEAYDLREDPGEMQNLAPTLDEERIAAARASLERILDANARFAERIRLGEAPLAPEQIEKLRSLGYIQ